jgi:hypothetical protein
MKITAKYVINNIEFNCEFDNINEMKEFINFFTNEEKKIEYKKPKPYDLDEVELDDNLKKEIEKLKYESIKPKPHDIHGVELDDNDIKRFKKMIDGHKKINKSFKNNFKADSSLDETTKKEYIKSILGDISNEELEKLKTEFNYIITKSKNMENKTFRPVADIEFYNKFKDIKNTLEEYKHDE